ncbi:hypothetical protein THAR02_03207 [Trichoderma harzianum]|uniref:Nephrocystin 3-like N-terminal domain-containing protein n=1 Tax=Trichoderma harzianum TaxID=5544 RepID=A0A0G0AIA4_TRIHA|nr:hypothetical protein THAR02_03207 [Trichoderma harzianum]
MDHIRQSAISENVFGDNANVHQGDYIINVPQGNLQISPYSGTGQLNLGYVPASFNDANKQHLSLCLPHTREQMLRDIRTWIEGNSKKGIYWLNGMAGTGKTTISLTIAHEYHHKKRLGASFFFSRGGGDLASTKKFAATIAVQLAEQSPELRRLILKATTLNPRIGHLNLYNQWEKLVLEPLRDLLLSSSVQQPLLIVVDALDESCRFIKEGGRNSEKRMLDLAASRSSASEAEKELDNIYTTVLESSFRAELSSREAVELQPEFQKIVGSGRDWVNHGGMKNFFWTDFLGWLESWLHDTSKKKNFQLSLQSQWKKMNLFPKSKTSDAVNTNHASDSSQSLAMLIYDAKRFAFQHSGIIEETPLQIYCSALIFSPEQSLIRQHYHAEIPSWIIPSFRRRNTWPRYTQALWHRQEARSLAFSPDGSYLASGCKDGTIWLWHAVTGAKQRIIEGHGKPITSISFSPTEELIASGSEDGTIRLWNSTTGATRGTLTFGENTHINEVAFSPKGASLASLATLYDSSTVAIGNYTVCMWDIASHAKQWTFVCGRLNLHISFLSDGAHVAYSDFTVTGLLDSKTGKSVCILAGCGGEICSSRLSSSSQMVGLRRNCDIELFDVQPSLFRLTTGFSLHPLTLEHFAFSADGTSIASTSWDEIIRFWDLSVTRQQSANDYPSRRVRGVFGIEPCQLFIWDAQEMMMKKNCPVAPKTIVSYMTFSPNSQFIAIYWVNSVVDLFEWESGERVFRSSEASNRPNYIEKFMGSTFSPNSNLFTFWTVNGYMYICDIRRRAIAHKLQVKYGQMAFSQDSKRIAYLSPNEEKPMFWSFDSNGQLVLFYHGKSSGPVQVQPGGPHTEVISHTIQLNHAPSSVFSFRPVPASNIVIAKLADRCCCSHKLSLEGFWIKRGNEKLVYIPPDYATALIAVRCNGVSFHTARALDKEGLDGKKLLLDAFSNSTGVLNSYRVASYADVSQHKTSDRTPHRKVKML